MTSKISLVFVFIGLLFCFPVFASISSMDIKPILGTDIEYAFNANSSGVAGNILKNEVTNVEDSNITNMLNDRIDLTDQKVINYSRSIAREYPGPYNIGQICAIFSKQYDHWIYLSDPHTNDDYLSSARASLDTCINGSCTGDCDDFAILMSGLIEAIGGTTRYISAKNTTRGIGHAYVEVYLGQFDSSNNQLEDLIGWLTRKYGSDTIFTHIDINTGDVWLNLDWSENHPGGAFFPSDRYYIYNLQQNVEKTTPMSVEGSIGIQSMNCSEIWVNIGRTLSNQSKFEDANECFDKAIKIDSNSPEAWNCSGNALNSLGNYNKAINAYQEAIKLDPTNAAFWNGLGYSYYYLGEYNETLRALEEAIRLDANLTAAWYNGGEALYHLGYYNESIKAYDRAIELDPKIEYVFHNNFTYIKFPFVVPKEIERNIKQIDIRSQVIGLESTYFTWNTDNFPGFYYDIDEDIGTEQIAIRLSELNLDRPKLSGDRPYGVTYTTTAQNKSFEQELWGSYSVIGFLGEKYFAGYVEGIDDATDVFFEGSVDASSLVDEQIEKILIDSDDEMTVTSDKPLKLEEGYELAIKSIELESNKVSIELFKNGKAVDSGTVYPSGDDWDKTYDYHPPYVGRQKKLITIGVHFKNAFRGADQNLATVDGIWQISDQPTEVSIDENFDKMSVISIDADSGTILMANKDNSITLSKNKDRTLMPGISIKIADNDTLRYCICKRATDPGDYQIRGAIVSSNDLVDNTFIWDSQNFPGFYYDINSDLGTECLKIVVDDTNKLSGDKPYGVTYTTTAQTKPFENEVFGEYKVVGFLGEKYFAGYVEGAAFQASNLFFEESMDEQSLRDEQLEKVL